MGELRWHGITALVLLFFAVSSFTPARTLRVGPTRTYTVPGQAAAAAIRGDTIAIDAGIYDGDVCAWTDSNLTIQGVGGFAHLRANGHHQEGKGIWVIKGANTLVENIEFSAAVVPDHNGAGIRAEGPHLTVRRCFFHDNEEGILTGNSGLSNIVIEYTEFARNGYGDGYSHNLYIGHERSLTFRYCYSHHANVGQNLKSRAEKNYILYNRIMDEESGNSSYLIDLPNGGTSWIIGNLLHQGTQTENSTLVSYGAEGFSNPLTDLYVVNNTLVNDRFTGVFINVRSGAVPAVVTNNIFVGNGTPLSGQGVMKTNLVTGSPGFVNRAAFDYRLTESSPARNAGSTPGTGNGFSLLPVSVYVHPTSSMPRTIIDSVDIGAYEYEGPVSVDADDLRMADRAELLQSYPNPFNSMTNVEFRMKNDGAASLRVFDIRAQLMGTLVAGYLRAGVHSVRWDATGYSTGIYLVRLEAGGRILSRKVLLLR